MKISIITLGKTQESYLKEGIALYEKRIRHYVPFEMIYLDEPRNMKSQPETVLKEYKVVEIRYDSVIVGFTRPEFSSETREIPMSRR